MENKKLWAKDSANLNHLEIIEKFTVGKDKDFDVLLAQYDILGTKAHCKMLAKIGFLTEEENDSIQKELDEMYVLAKQNQLFINDGVEDIHSQIEFNLMEKLGDAGKKSIPEDREMIRFYWQSNYFWRQKSKKLQIFPKNYLSY